MRQAREATSAPWGDEWAKRVLTSARRMHDDAAILKY
jgi:hypothetical protein